MSTIKPKIQGKFYALQNDEWTTLTQMLTHSELIVLYHLRTLDPFGDRFQETSTKSIAATLKISQRTVQRSILKLSNLQLIEIEIGKFNFRVRSKNEAICPETDIDDSHIGITPGDDTGVIMATPVSHSRHQRRDDDIHVASPSQVSPTAAETVDEQKIDISHTLHIQKDLNRSLSPKIDQRPKSPKKISQPQKYQNFKDSESEEDIQKFKDFCYRKSLALSTPVVLMEKWIGSNFDELYEFYLAAGRRNISQAVIQEIPKSYDDHPGIIAGLADGRIRQLDTGFLGTPSLWATQEQGGWQSQKEWLERNDYL